MADAILDEIERLGEKRKRDAVDRLLSQFQSCGVGVRINGEIKVTDPRSVAIGNNVHIGSNAYFSSAGGLVIADNVHISRNVTIYTVNHNYAGEALPYDQLELPKPVIIGKNVWIGMNVSIVPGVRIGAGAIVGMGTVVTHNVPPLAIVGSPRHRILKSRSLKDYQDLEQKKKYGARSGRLLSREELRGFSRRFDDPQTKLFFVVTTGRSGSKTIAHVLSQHPQIYCAHEPRPQLIRLSTDLAHGKLTYDQVKEELQDIYFNSVSAVEVYGECDQKLFNLIPLLNELFPSSKFIWLLRDGRDVVASAVNRSWFSEKDVENGSPTGIEYRERWNYYRLNGGKSGFFDTDEWEQLSPFERNCWYWYYVNDHIERSLAALPQNRWICVALENLMSELDRIFAFLGVERIEVNVPHRNKAQTRPRYYNEWTSAEMETFARWCGNMMNKMYPNWSATTSWNSRAYEECCSGTSYIGMVK